MRLGLEEQDFWDIVNPFSWWYGDPSKHSELDRQIRDRAVSEAQRDIATDSTFDRGMRRLRDVQAQQCRTAVKDATGLAKTAVNFDGMAYGGGFVRPSGGGSLRGARLARSGRVAEESVSGAIGIPINRGRGIHIIPGSGKGGIRIPDLRVFGEGGSIGVRGSIIEVKDTARLYCSRQIEDLARFGEEHGIVVEIFSNGRIPKTGRLREYIDAGRVIIHPIPGK